MEIYVYMYTCMYAAAVESPLHSSEWFPKVSDFVWKPRIFKSFILRLGPWKAILGIGFEPQQPQSSPRATGVWV